MSDDIYNNLWIKVDGGETFDGQISHWEDCFFSNVSIESIVDFCLKQGWKVEFSIIKGIKNEC